MWFEVRMQQDAKPDPFYAAMGEVNRFHHFFNEPWWPGRYIIRLDTDDHTIDSLERLPGAEEVMEWDPSDDEELFGVGWDWVCEFLQASSCLAAMNERRDMTGKLLHCFLNARGMNIHDEIAFARLFLSERLKMAKGVSS